MNSNNDFSLGRGRVIEEHFNEWLIQFEDQKTYRIHRAKVDTAFENLKVGDWIQCELTANADILPTMMEARRTQMSRRSNLGEEQILAVNVDLVLILTSANEDFNLNRLRRFIVLARSAQIQPVILLSKVDLVEDSQFYIDQIENEFAGIQVLAVSSLNEVALSRVKELLLPHFTVALVGSSGVGKSTLINKLLGDDKLLTREIREDDGKGKHTTSGRSLHQLTNHCWLMDTPGLRQVGLISSEDGMAEIFEDIYDLMKQCKFSDCQHQTEPFCAIQATLENGSLPVKRWQEYLKFEKENRARNRKLRSQHEHREDKRQQKKMQLEMREIIKHKRR